MQRPKLLRTCESHLKLALLRWLDRSTLFQAFRYNLSSKTLSGPFGPLTLTSLKTINLEVGHGTTTCLAETAIRGLPFEAVSSQDIPCPTQSISSVAFSSELFWVLSPRWSITCDKYARKPVKTTSASPSRTQRYSPWSALEIHRRSTFPQPIQNSAVLEREPSDDLVLIPP
jgi:hypothetical protein